MPRSALLPLCLLLACDITAEPPTQCESPETSMRRLASNGMMLNGIDFQGVWLNGIDVQGVWLNAFTWNGLMLNGLMVNSVALDSSGIVALDPRGRRVEGDDLVGASIPSRLADGSVIELEILAADGPSIALGYEGVNLCGHNGRGRFVPGVWDLETGDRRDALADDEDFAVSFSCDSGVIAKCVSWGYDPTEVGADAHQACVRMARADYCGDGTPHTKNGTAIDVGDALGVQTTTHDPSFEFEAGWGPEGAVCVSKPRYHERVVGQGELLPTCWNALPQCDDPGEAMELGATIVNRSRPQERLLCEPRG